MKLKVQWCAIEMERLLHKHYIVNGVTLNQQFIPWKSYHDLRLLTPNRYQLDLSNEVLNIDLGQETLRISKVKVEGWKISADSAWLEIVSPTPGWTDLFFQPPTLTFDVFAALWLKSMFSTKDLIYICLEPEAQQGHGMTFRVYSLGSH